MRKPPAWQNFWDHVAKGRANACWNWQKARDRHGYGILNIKGRSRLAHRLAWGLHHNKPAPEDMHVCHHCDNPACCNPRHLFLGTYLDNVQDMIGKGRDRRGRKLTPKQVLFIAAQPIERRTTASLAARFGVMPNTITRIRTGARWGKITKRRKK